MSPILFDTVEESTGAGGEDKWGVDDLPLLARMDGMREGIE